MLPVTYKPRHFRVEELVDRETYKKFGEGALAFFRPEALMALDSIRDLFGVPVTVNNWFWGGSLSCRGLRHDACSGTGEKYSAHKFGAGFDISVAGVDAEEVRRRLKDARNSNFGHLRLIRRIEKGTPAHVHFDVLALPGGTVMESLD